MAIVLLYHVYYHKIKACRCYCLPNDQHSCANIQHQLNHSYDRFILHSCEHRTLQVTLVKQDIAPKSIGLEVTHSS